MALIRILTVGTVAALFFIYLIRPARLIGVSMEPTLNDGALGFINLVHYRHNEPQRGDIIAVKMPGGRTFYLKRIIGLPGEAISFQKGQLHIDEHSVNEPYLSDQGDWELPPVKIPAEHYFVAGDNRRTSIEGHTMGTIHASRIAGKLLGNHP